MGQIRRYNNSITITFEESGKNLTLDVPHYNKWLSIISFLRRRGFKVGKNPRYKEDYACLSKYHKLGSKKEVICLLEIHPKSIELNFGHSKNFWHDLKLSFWDHWHDKYTALEYLEGLAVELEVKRLLHFCEKYNFQFKDATRKLSPEEYIVDKLQMNTHIHGEVKSLIDIKKAIQPGDYDYECNSNDRDKNKIICGQKKYYYDYRTRRLACGIVWHNINNMWWVISGKELRNIASFELFDYAPSLPLRKPLEKGQIERLLKKYEQKRDYQRCMHIKTYAERRHLFAS